MDTCGLETDLGLNARHLISSHLIASHREWVHPGPDHRSAFNSAQLSQSTVVKVVRIMDATVTPQERTSERFFEAITEEIMKVAQIMDVPVPQCQEDIVEVITVIPLERISERKLGPIMEKMVKDVQIMEVRTEEQIVNMRVLQLQETIMLNAVVNTSWMFQWYRFKGKWWKA